MRETFELGIMAKLAFSCQKSIPATLSNEAERTLARPSASVSRLNNFLLIRLFPVSLVGFQKFFLFWVAGIILNCWEAELEMDPVIGNQCYKLVVCLTTSDFFELAVVSELSWSFAHIDCKQKHATSLRKILLTCLTSQKTGFFIPTKITIYIVPS